MVHREAEWIASAFKPSNIIGFKVPGEESTRVESLVVYVGNVYQEVATSQTVVIIVAHI